MPKARVTRSFGAARLEENDPPPRTRNQKAMGRRGLVPLAGRLGEDAAAAAAASARRLAAASAVTEELAKARATVGSFKSSLGKVKERAP